MIDFFNSGEERFDKHELTRFVLHTLFALACVPVYMSPYYALFGLLTGTALLYFIFRPRSEYLLPLMIHTMWGSQQRYIMLAGCFLYALVHFNRLRQYKLQGIFVVYLLVLPFFIWHTWKRYVWFGGGIGAGGTFLSMSYYLAFAPFFWGVIACLRITREMFVASIIVGFLVFINFALHLPFTRMIFWSADFMPVFLLWVALNSHFRKYFIDCIIAVICLVGLFLGFTGKINLYVSFTQVGVMALGVVFVIFAKWRGGLLRVIRPIFFFVATILLTFYTISSFEEKGRQVQLQYERYDDIKATSIDAIREKLLLKIFNDRAPLWAASWDSIMQQAKKDPIWVATDRTVGIIFADDGRIVEVDLMAHNILLLLLQDYGWYGGLGLYLIYIALFTRKETHEIILKDNQSYYSLIGALCFAHGIIGGYTGQYVMTWEFSFILYGFLGCVFVRYYRLNEARYQIR